MGVAQGCWQQVLDSHTPKVLPQYDWQEQA